MTLQTDRHRWILVARSYPCSLGKIRVRIEKTLGTYVFTHYLDLHFENNGKSEKYYYIFLFSILDW